MYRHNNVNEIVSITTNNNVNDNDRGRDYDKGKKVEIIADRLVEKLGNKEFRQFYCKVAWNLSEARIWANLEQAEKGNSPARLFSYLCKRDGV